ncbi:hypothetical protein HN682_06925 [Candidatus Peregrinibacteria bacterium]|jgi:hypothetical protein|nr:hypothetical protein [Candidatus Peregrinibacteria bacterium]
MADVTVTPPDTISVTVSESTNADQILFTSTNDGLSSETNLSSAVNELASRFFQLSSAPTGANINEGDLWYDLTVSKLKVYDGSGWDNVGGETSAGTNDTNGWLEFASPTTYTSGALFKLKNNTSTVFKVNYDGALQLNTISNKGTAVTGRFVFDGTSMYIGV